MVVQGFARYRKHQFARQAVQGTPVAATQAYPFSGVPSNELNWTDPEIDAGSVDIVAAPYRGAFDLTAPLEVPSLEYNMLPLILCGFFGGGVVPTSSGTSRSWAYDPASETVDPFDLFTYQFGDDVLTDWFQYWDSVVESFELTGPEGLGVLTGTVTFRNGAIASTGSTDSPVTGTVPTPGLSVDTNGAKVYLKDAALYIASSTAGLAAGQISDALHTFVLRASQELDEKRWANGDQSFAVDAYGRASRLIELELTFAKTDDTVGTGSESDAWMSDEAVNRFIRLTFTSTVMASTGPNVPYSWTFTMPARYYTRVEGDIGGNTTVILTARAFFDPDDLDGIFPTTVVNTLTEAELGSVPS